MTFAQWVCKNLVRNRRRTTLTVASVIVSTFLLTTLVATYRFIYVSQGGEDLRLVLFVAPRVNPNLTPLPLSYVNRIARLPRAAAVTPLDWFHAYYRRPDDIIPTFACDPVALFKIFSMWQMPSDQREAFFKEKIAIVAGRLTAQRYGLKVGDHFTLVDIDNNQSLDFVLRGIYASPGDETMMAFHWDYLNDARGQMNKPGRIWVLARRDEEVPQLIKDVDGLFLNNEIETRTETMKQFTLDFLATLGNVKLILVSISAAVLFALLLIVANTMAMSIRERTSELAVGRSATA